MIARTRVVAVTRADDPIEVVIEDATGRLVRARSLDPAEVDTFGKSGVHRAPADPDAIWVTWSDTPCESRGRLSIEPDGVIALALAPRPACDAIGTWRGLELGFLAPVDPDELRLVDRGAALVSPSDLRPTTVTSAPADSQVTWIGGTSEAGDALVLRRSASPELYGLGRGEVVDLEYVGWTFDGAGAVLAAVSCDSGVPGCRAGLYSGGDGPFARISKEPFLTIAGSPDARAVGVVGGGEPRLLTSSDEGASWTQVMNPCEARGLAIDAAPTKDGFLVLCAADVGSTLVRTHDGGRTWVPVATPSLQPPATAVELASDGSGWLWAAGSRAAATSDGRSWSLVADDRVPQGRLIAVDLADHTVVALVGSDRTVRVVRSPFGAAAWAVIAEWPAPP